MSRIALAVIVVLGLAAGARGARAWRPGGSGRNRLGFHRRPARAAARVRHQPAVRRAADVREAAVHDGVLRPARRRAAVGPRLSDGGHARDEDPERAHAGPAADGRIQRVVARRIRSCTTIRSPTCRSRGSGRWTKTRSRACAPTCRRADSSCSTTSAAGTGTTCRTRCGWSFRSDSGCELDASHPIFHSFFEINDPHTMTPPYGGMPPMFYAMFENNDRNGR